MTTTQIPPVPPPQSTQKSAPAAPSHAVVKAAPVRQSPERPSDQERRHVEGRIAENNRARREVRVATREGEVVIEADTDLPPGTEVALELYLEKKALLANMRVQQQIRNMEREALQAAKPPAPPLAPGDKVVALILPGESAAAHDARDLELRQAAAALEQAKQAGFEKIPASLRAAFPDIPPALGSVLAATDVFQALQNLPPADRQAIKDFMAQPAVVSALKQFMSSAQAAALETSQQTLLQQAMSAYEKPHFTGAPAPGGATPDITDNNLLQIMKAQISARLTQDALQAPSGQPAAPSPLPMVKTLLPFIDSLASRTAPLPGELRPFMPPAALAQLQEADHALSRKFVQMNIAQVIPPGGAVPPLAPGQQAGLVETATPGGSPLLRTDDAHLVLRTAASVAEGSVIIFEPSPMTLEQILAQQGAAGAERTAPPATGFEPLLSKNWPALQEAAEILSQNAPQAAALLRDTLPSPTPKLVPTALFFLAALRAGSVESWLGAKILQTLKSDAKKDAAEKLGADFGKISSQSKEALSGEWRAISMPLLHDDHLGQIQFFVRRQPDEEKKGEDGADSKPVTRFILNLALSRMGDMQLDGLLRQKRFDLILRSADQLPFPMRQELMQAFARGVAQAGMQGGISFQTRAQGWVGIPMPEHAGTIA